MNPVLSTQMGTRHRAGIGITEETDAIAVIVSEETGAISMAVGGKIERELTVEQLRERLSSELRRYMSPVALPTVGPQEDDSDAGEESPLRPRAQIGADGDSERETERPL
jgi:diadenylate cyclase